MRQLCGVEARLSKWLVLAVRFYLSIVIAFSISAFFSFQYNFIYSLWLLSKIFP
jgi:hypothetical protein